MVQSPEVAIVNNPHAGVRAADFVGRTQGKLRDFYRIGKVLGTGKYWRRCKRRKDSVFKVVINSN